MNRLPYTTTLISVAAAVALWLVATWLESDSPWLQPPPDIEQPLSGSTVRDDSPVAVDEGPAACVVAETELQQRVNESQHCATDDDCTLFDYGYPIECLTSVAKSEISALRLEYRNYEQSCDYRVYYDCETGSMERNAVCRNNRCEVELQSSGFLEEQTLDYLGIDPRR